MEGKWTEKIPLKIQYVLFLKRNLLKRIQLWAIEIA